MKQIDAENASGQVGCLAFIWIAITALAKAFNWVEFSWFWVFWPAWLVLLVIFLIFVANLIFKSKEK